jgi:ATP-dependent DNA ligase
VFEHACRLGLEGIVSKRRDMPYRHGRLRTWLKVKNPASPAAMADHGRQLLIGRASAVPQQQTFASERGHFC